MIEKLGFVILFATPLAAKLYRPELSWALVASAIATVGAMLALRLVFRAFFESKENAALGVRVIKKAAGNIARHSAE